MTMTDGHSERQRRTCGERGAVLVEAAIAIPLLILLIFGGIELGMAWEARSASTSGVRTGLLRAASMGDAPATDLRVLQSVVGEIGAENVNGIAWVIIFNADNVDPDTVIANCSASAGAVGGRGVANLCTAYDTSDLVGVLGATITAADFDDGSNSDEASGTYDCDSTKIDSRFCSGDRLTNGAINVGVAVRYHKDWTTGTLPGDGLTFTEFSISSTLLGEQAAAPLTATTTTTTAAPTTTTSTTVPVGTNYSPSGSPTSVGSQTFEGGPCCGVSSYIQFQTPSDFHSGPPSEPRVDIDFNVPENASYSLQGLVYSFDASWANSYNEVWIVIDGDLDNPILWEWDTNDPGFNEEGSPSFVLSAGDHTISIHPKENYSAFSLDSVSLEKV